MLFRSVGNGAHEALNNILAVKAPTKANSLVDHNGVVYTAPADTAKKVEIAEDRTTFQKSVYNDDYDVVNQFDNADLNYWQANAHEYLTRQDWNTFPTTLSSFTATDAMKTEINNNNHHSPSDSEYYTQGSGVNFGVQLKTVDAEGNEVKKKITFADMANVPFSGTYTDADGNEQDADQMWKDFISQMTVDDLAISMSDNRGIKAVTRISKPSNSIAEGPEGLLAQFNYGDKRWATGFATGPVYSATWDHEMQKKFGGFYGEEAIFCGAAGVNAPGTNILRTPYGSRASEYMSEDGIMNYYIAANVVSEALKKGLVMNIKHCFLNNQETSRHGINTFANEQSIREIYLKPFEGALTKGHGLGIMTSYNRIGVRYAACHEPLMKNVMREEWGYKGLIIDDALTGSNTSNYSNGPAMLHCGTDLFCLDGGRGGQLKQWVEGHDDGTILRDLQRANKYVMYAISRSWMGGVRVSEEEIVANMNPWWKKTVTGLQISITAITGALVAAYIFFEIFDMIMEKKKGPAAEEE